MGFSKLVTLSFDEEHFHIVVIKKDPHCAIKDCDEYGTEKVGCLKMCPPHSREAKD